jgi:hypothetical protein
MQLKAQQPMRRTAIIDRRDRVQKGAGRVPTQPLRGRFAQRVFGASASIPRDSP